MTLRRDGTHRVRRSRFLAHDVVLPDQAQARLVEIGEQEETGADGARRPTLVLPRTTVRSRNGMCPALVERPVSLADVVSMAMM